MATLKPVNKQQKFVRRRNDVVLESNEENGSVFEIRAKLIIINWSYVWKLQTKAGLEL